jgi:Flp pilus assembly protein TadD
MTRLFETDVGLKADLQENSRSVGRPSGRLLSRRCLTSTAIAVLACAIAACSSMSVGPPRKSSPRTSPSTRSAVPPPGAAAKPSATVVKGDANQRFNAALKLMKDHQPAEAQAAFLALAQDFPAMSGALTNLGILYAQGRQRDQAVASMAKAVSANPKNAVALNWLGTLYRESGDFVRAEQAYRSALSVRPDYAAAHLNLGLLYELSLRRPRDALAKYRDYQRHAGGENLIVTSWIKELEIATAGPVAPSAGSAAGAAP